MNMMYGMLGLMIVAVLGGRLLRWVIHLQERQDKQLNPYKKQKIIQR
jgi:hypothetical protein